MESPETILSSLGLSRTKSRMDILTILQQSKAPLSGGEISRRLSGHCDKSTVYRTLQSLYERELLQRVLIDHEVKYALRINHGSGKEAGADHVHFKCVRCEKVYCMKELIVEDYHLPEGFEKSENQFLILGVCRTCSRN